LWKFWGSWDGCELFLILFGNIVDVGVNGVYVLSNIGGSLLLGEYSH
jgi:hypothetical protein